MDVRDITAENVAKAVGGTVERDGSILCRCPVHEASGTHNPSLLLSITDERRILFHCRSQNCDAKHFQAIRDHLVKSAACRDRMSAATVRTRRSATPINTPTGAMPGPRPGTSRRSGKKRFRCEVWDETTKQWSSGRPEGMPLLFNLAAIASVLAAYPDNSPADRRGREGRHHGGRTRRARHHQRRRRRQVARRRHANTDQAGSAQGRRLPRQ